MPTILLLEDDISLNETVTEFLEDNGFSVISTYDGEEAQDKIYENKADLLLLDVNVPNINGFTLLKEERKKKNNTPAIFITSLDGIEDVEKGFTNGANDYIRKPFVLRELLLRINNLIKTQTQEEEILKITDNIHLNTKTHEIYIGKTTHTLQNKEALLLKLFISKREKVVPHQIIFDTLWDYNEAPSDQALRTYIKNLRKLIGKESIVSFKKLGYKFTP